MQAARLPVHEISSRGTGVALARCVGNVDEFLLRSWANQPHHHASENSAGFADLLSFGDVDRLLSTTFPRLPSFRLVRDGKMLDRSTYTRKAGLASELLNDVGDVGRIFYEFHNGATIVLQGLQRYWTPLADFCRDLELTITHPVQANAYITPPNSRGLGIHYDTHDVFVLQTAGSKSWDVHQCAMAFPLSTQHGRPFGKLEPAILSLQLRAGESLYLPRGFLHQAVSTDEISIHITIGLLCYTWWDLLQEIVAGAKESPRLREALPAGFAHHTAHAVPTLRACMNDFKSYLDEADLDEAIERLGRRFWFSRTPFLAGHLEQLANLDAVNDSTLLRIRSNCSYYLYVDKDGGEVVLQLGDRQVRMPGALEAAVQEMLMRESFRVGELAEFLDAASRQTLCRRLVREGLFEAELDTNLFPHSM